MRIKLNQTNSSLDTVFENYRTSLIQDYERSELRFEWTKVNLIVNFGVFENFKLAVRQYYQTGRSLLIGQKLVKNANNEKLT